MLPRAEPPPRHLLRASLALAAVLVAAKAYDLGRSPGGSFTAVDLLVVSHRDVALVAVVAAPLAPALAAARRWPRVERALHALFVALGVIVAGYAVVASQAYANLWVPLTYRLVAIAGGVSGAWSTAREVVTAGFALALAAAVGAFVAAALGPGWPAAAGRRTRLRWLAWPCALAGAGALTLAGASEQWRWAGRRDRALVDSPHLVMLESLLLDRDRTHERPSLGLDVTPGPGDGADLARPFASPPARGGRPPRGVILYVLESTGAGYLEPFGGPPGVGVRLGQLAARGLLFESAYANLGRTEGALATLTLSTYLPQTWRWFTEDHPDAPGTSLASLLAGRGFRTAFVSAADLDYAGQRAFLRTRGFAQIADGERLGCPPISAWGTSDACLVDALLRTVDERPGQPFFAVAWTNQSHHPYPVPGEARPALDRSGDPRALGYRLETYLGAVREADRQLGRLVDGLRERGLLDDTLLVVTGDHGESFGAHGANAGHGLHLYEEAVRVPLVLHWPAGLPDPGRRPLVCSHLDVTPTLAHLLGLPQAPDWFGRSVLDPSHPGRAYLLASSDSLMVGLREGTTKYTVNLWSGRDALFDLASDPTEDHDLAPDQPARTLEPRRRLAAWVKLSRSLWRTDAVSLLPPPPSARSSLHPPQAPAPGATGR